MPTKRIFLLLPCLLLVSTAFATLECHMVVNVDFMTNDSQSGMPYTLYYGQGAYPADGDYWNPAVSEHGSQLDLTHLLASDGLTDSGMRVQVSFDGHEGSSSNPPMADPVDLMGDYLYTSDTIQNIMISNLVSNTEYTLVLYGSGQSEGQGTNWTLNGQSITTAGTDLSTSEMTWDEDFVFLAVMSDENGVISGTWQSADGDFAAFNGMQIIGPCVPEPATMVLLGLGVIIPILSKTKRYI